MKRNSFFENLRNFLALWAGILAIIFLGNEIVEMVKTFIQNLKPAFESATGVGVVLASMAASALATILVAIIRNVRGRNEE